MGDTGLEDGSISGVEGSRFPPDCGPSSGSPEGSMVLTEEERLTLERPTNRPRTAQSTALRSRIVPACAEKAQPTNQEVAARLKVNQATCREVARTVQ